MIFIQEIVTFFPTYNIVVLILHIAYCTVVIPISYQVCTSSPVFFPLPSPFILGSAGFCVQASVDPAGCSADVTRCLQLAAAAGGPSAQSESAGGIKGPSPKKATGVGLRLVCSPRCVVTSSVCVCV